MKYVPVQKLTIKTRNKNKELSNIAEKNSASVDYIAMMADIDLPEDKEANENV